MPLSAVGRSAADRLPPPAPNSVIVVQEGGEGSREFVISGRGGDLAGCRVAVIREAIGVATSVPTELQSLWECGRPLGDDECPSGDSPLLLRQAPPAPPDSVAPAALRTRVWSFYQYYAPHRLEDPAWLDTLLRSWQDVPSLLWDSLLRKYGPWPPPRARGRRRRREEATFGRPSQQYISMSRSLSYEEERRRRLCASVPLSPQRQRPQEPSVSLDWPRPSRPAADVTRGAAELSLLEDYLCHRASVPPPTGFALRSPRGPAVPPDDDTLAEAILRREREVARLRRLIAEHDAFLELERREAAEAEERAAALRKELAEVEEFKAKMPDAVVVRVRRGEGLLADSGAEAVLGMALLRATPRVRLRRTPAAAATAAACVIALASPHSTGGALSAAGWGCVRAPKGAVVRSGEAMDSAEVEKLPQGTRVQVAELKGRRARITAPSQGWLSVETQAGDVIVAPASSRPPPEQAPPPRAGAAGRARVAASKGALARREQSLKSEEVQKLGHAAVVEIAEVVGRRARITSPCAGWVSTETQAGVLVVTAADDPIASVSAGQVPLMPLPLRAGENWPGVGTLSDSDVRAVRPRCLRRRPTWLVPAAEAGGAVELRVLSPARLFALWPDSAPVPGWLQLPRAGHISCNGGRYIVHKGPSLDAGGEWKAAGAGTYTLAVMRVGDGGGSGGDGDDSSSGDEAAAWLRPGARVAAPARKWSKGTAIRPVSDEADLLHGLWWVAMDATGSAAPGSKRTPALLNPAELVQWPSHDRLHETKPAPCTASTGGRGGCKVTWDGDEERVDTEGDTVGIGLHVLVRSGRKCVGWGELHVSPNDLVKARREEGRCMTREVRLRMPADDCAYTERGEPESPAVTDDEEAAPQPLREAGVGVVQSKFVRVRAEPHDAAEETGKLPKGTRLDVADVIQGAGGVWLRVDDGTVKGWARPFTSSGGCAVAEYVAPEERQKRRSERRDELRKARLRQQKATQRRRQWKAREANPRPAGSVFVELTALGAPPQELPPHSGFAGPVAGRQDKWSVSSGEEGWAERALSFRTVMMIKKVAARARARVAARGGAAAAKAGDFCPITGRRFAKLADIDFSARPCVEPLYQMGQPNILWAAPVTKQAAKKGRMEQRTLVLTPSSLLIGHREDLLRCISLANVSSLIVVADTDWIALKVPAEYDLYFRLDLPRRSDEMDHFIELFVPLCRHHGGDGFEVQRPATFSLDALSLRPPRGWSAPPMTGQITIS